MTLWGSRPSDLQSRIDDIQNGLSALAGLLGKRVDAAGESAHEAADRLGPLLSDITDQIDSALSVAKREGRHAYKAVETRVSDNPMIAVAAAAGVGLLIGSLLLNGRARRAVSSLSTAVGGNSPNAQQRRPKAASRRRGGGRSRKAA